MNTPSPLVPQGSLLDQKKKRKSRILFTVFGIIALHVVPITGLLLMQGCKQEEKRADLPLTEATNNFLPVMDTTALYGTNAAAQDTNVVMVPPGTYDTTVAPGQVASQPVTPFVPDPVVPAIGEYKVLKGDTFAKIAKKHGTTVTAIAAANPGVDPTKLQISQKLQVPAATKPVTAADVAAGMSPLDAGSAESQALTYQVKSGDSLMKIAKKHGTTVKAIRTANNLKSDRILVGQKLKIPAAAPKAPSKAPEPAGLGAPAAGVDPGLPPSTAPSVVPATASRPAGGTV